MKKTIALFIAMIMMIGCFITVFHNISFAQDANNIVNEEPNEPQEEPGENPQQEPGENPQQEPGENPQQEPGENPQQEPGENPQQEPGENPQQEPGAEPAEGRILTVDFGTARWEVNEVTVTAGSSDFQDLTQGPVEINERTNIKLGNFNPNTMQIKVTSEGGMNTLLWVNEEKNGNDYETKLENKPQESNYPDNETLTFVVESKPVDSGEEQQDTDDITINAHFANTHMRASINNTQFMDDENGNLKDSFEGVVPSAGTTDPNKTNKFKFQNVYGDAPVEEYTINNKVYKEGDEGVTIGSEGEFEIVVPGAEEYIITGEADPDFIGPKTVIWTNPNYVPRDADDEAWIQEFKLENGYGYVAEVYDVEGHLIDPDEYRAQNWYVNENGAGVGSDGFGWIELQPGSRVVFEFQPEYGYQLTDIRINGQPLGLSELMNRFEFVMPNNNIHFDAEFTATEDVLKSESDEIKDGRIVLPDNTLDSGTAQLRVKDIELDANKIKGFTDAAEDLELKTFLDIDLYQVFYKGKDDDEDVWENKIDELEKEVEISFKLQDGVKAEDVVIVHNIHNGDEYEIIKITKYDAATNTITFKTKSFSNYAIATKSATSPAFIGIRDLESNVFISFYEKGEYDADDFVFIATDITNLTDEQIAELGLTRAEYDEGLKKIKEASKQYGGLILLYNLQVSISKENRELTEGPFTIRIPYTDELKGYENFKLAYVDDDYSLKEVIELVLEDGYLVGELEHLSPYALVGKVIEKEEEKEEEEITPVEPEYKGNNPSTGDNIIIFSSIFVLSALAMTFELIVIKKSKNFR